VNCIVFDKALSFLDIVYASPLLTTFPLLCDSHAFVAPIERLCISPLTSRKNTTLKVSYLTALLVVIYLDSLLGAHKLAKQASKLPPAINSIGPKGIASLAVLLSSTTNKRWLCPKREI